MEDGDGGIDRISDLTDDILLHILSFVPARAVARASVLSERWRRLRSLNRSLYFDMREYRSMVLFKHHVERALQACDADGFIPNYRVVATLDMDHDTIHQWLNFAKNRNIAEMEFELLPGYGYDFAGVVHDIFGHCQSLQRLKLVMPHWSLDLDNAFGLKNLKFLHLNGVRHAAGLSMMISGSHVLEEMHLEDCRLDYLSISANELKRLSIANCVFSDHKVEVYTPKLLSFRYACGKIQRCCIQDMSSLVSASISILDSIWLGRLVESKIAKEIIEGLLNAKILTFTYLGHLSVEEHLNFLPTFLNMKCLRLKMMINSDHMKAISSMLRHMPNLETLVVYNERVRMRSKREEKTRWITKDITYWKLNSIKKIELGNFESTKHEMEFVDFLIVTGRLRYHVNK